MADFRRQAGCYLSGGSAPVSGTQTTGSCANPGLPSHNILAGKQRGRINPSTDSKSQETPATFQRSERPAHPPTVNQDFLSSASWIQDGGSVIRLAALRLYQQRQNGSQIPSIPSFHCEGPYLRADTSRSFQSSDLTDPEFRAWLDGWTAGWLDGWMTRRRQRRTDVNCGNWT